MLKNRIIILIVAVLVVVGGVAGGLYYCMRTTSESTSLISFEEAAAVLIGGSPKWIGFGTYRNLGSFEGEPFVTEDGLTIGYFEWRASNGTLYEAEYPSGKVYGEVEVFSGMEEETEEYYVWNIILMDGRKRWVDARNGDRLCDMPTRVPGVLTFSTATRIIDAPKKTVEEWDVKTYERIGEFEGSGHETNDGLVKGHLLWRVSNGTFYQVWSPFISDPGNKILYIEVPEDTENYNVWEIITEDKTYYIDARNGVIKLILSAS